MLRSSSCESLASQVLTQILRRMCRVRERMRNFLCWSAVQDSDLDCAQEGSHGSAVLARTVSQTAEGVGGAAAVFDAFSSGKGLPDMPF